MGEKIDGYTYVREFEREVLDSGQGTEVANKALRVLLSSSHHLTRNVIHYIEHMRLVDATSLGRLVTRFQSRLNQVGAQVEISYDRDVTTVTLTIADITECIDWILNSDSYITARGRSILWPPVKAQ